MINNSTVVACLKNLFWIFIKFDSKYLIFVALIASDYLKISLIFFFVNIEKNLPNIYLTSHMLFKY